ncbi:hypothetical protein D3C76_1539530 [compost metagenome]
METVGRAVIQHFPALSQLRHQAISIRIDIKQAIVKLCREGVDNQAAACFLWVQGVDLPVHAIDKTAVANIRKRSRFGRSKDQAAKQTECNQGR